MPRAMRRPRAKRGRKRRASRSRRKSVKKKKAKRFVRATRHLPPKKSLQFEYRGQFSATTIDGGWGIISIPANVMERPLGTLEDPTPPTAELVTDIVGSVTRQPGGYDKWIAATTTTEGKYFKYRVESSTATITHLPQDRSSEGANLLWGVGKMTADQNDWQAVYQGFVVTDVSPLLGPKSPILRMKTMNIGDIGQSQTSKWSRLAQRRMDGGSHILQVDKDWLLHNGSVDSADFLQQFHHFVLAELGHQTSSTLTLNFLITIKYQCTLIEPTSWSASEDATGGEFTTLS